MKKGKVSSNVIEYSIGRLVYRYIVVLVVVMFVFSSDLKSLHVFLFVLAHTLLFYLQFRSSYKKIYVSENNLSIFYSKISFKKPLIYNFSQIEYFFFQIHGGYYGDLYFNIHFVNGKKKRVYLSRGEIAVLREYLRDKGLKTKNSKYTGEGAGW
ncbi:hypothetical protein [Ohtaekwangia koreensis]|uniref:PH domain-containing protein n=1 Tax=Ohtaekwangia koreensis TaxID=688867 RepID=A0A1T5MA35_9BACT|nr:hypothetical protein [Ohtaekwangia koreensis]SKC85110.1 hypothetical protein SAMN05660236_4823 [Ohtaekwangia koreensis]